MFVNSDLTDLLSRFNARSVRYLVVGGYAVVQHAVPRFTNDLDLFVGADARNAVAVFDALRDFGAPLAGLAASDFQELGYFYRMGTPPSRVDILMGISGVSFDPAWQRRMEVDFDGLLVPFISREDLIEAKRASGRPQDLLDVESLLRRR